MRMGNFRILMKESSHTHGKILAYAWKIAHIGLDFGAGRLAFHGDFWYNTANNNMMAYGKQEL